MPIQLYVWERRDSADRLALANAALDLCRSARAIKGISSSKFYWYGPDTVVTLTEGETEALDAPSDSMPDDWEIEYFGDTAQEPEGDYDSDGLNNLGEYQNETDPTEPDTDADQMPDGWEVVYGFNPLDASDSNADSDGDGLTNLEEYLGGTDPISEA